VFIIFVRRRTENTNAICEKTAGLRSGNFSDLNSACSKMLVTMKIFQFHDMLNENRFLGTFLGQGKRPIRPCRKMDIRGGLEFSRTFYRAIGPNRAIMRRMRSKMRKM
jgi:hypothetical protein